MNRPIKTKAWDYEKKKWVEHYSINPEGFAYTDESEEPNFNINLLQFTGLKDKHGKEIYEGDIIEFEYHNGGGFSRVKEPVTFYNGQFSVWQESINNYNENCEIIGNIFENPKILNENKLL